MRKLPQFFKPIGIAIVPIVIGLFIYGSLVLSALASPPTHAPKGYLIPTPGSIPKGFSQVERLYPPYTDDSYVLEYTSENHTDGHLVISESPANPKWNYNGLVHGFEKLARDTKQWRVTEKVKEIDCMGVHGVLFHHLADGISGYDLLIDDDTKILRIQAQDGPHYHFDTDAIMTVVNGLVRQQ